MGCDPWARWTSNGPAAHTAVQQADTAGEGPMEQIAYEADGVRMIGQLVVGAGGHRRPGVLVAHESPGVTSHVTDIAQRLADLGYVAFALDYQGGGVPVTDRDEMMRRYAAFMADPASIRARTGAALEVLRAHPLVDA